jgi:carboxypeptidase C (cathepsin A)
LLFLESPAIVGFSTDRNMTYQYTDESTAKDAFQSLKDFIFTKAPEFANRPLYVSELMIQITG